MSKRIKTLTPGEQDAAIKTLARAHVDRWIENGWTVPDMKEASKHTVRYFDELIARDIERFAATGKYPKWAEAEEVKP